MQGREREEGVGEIFTLELRRERSGSAETLLPGPEAATSPPEAVTSGSSFLQEVTRWDQHSTVLYCTVLYCTAGGTSAPSTSDHGLERDGIGTEILRP